LDSFLSFNILAKGSISITYNLMTNLTSSSLDNIKRAWEEDFDRPLSEKHMELRSQTDPLIVNVCSGIRLYSLK